MGVDTNWTSPAAGGALDLATGGTVNETIWDAVISDLLHLGGTAGYVSAAALAAGATGQSILAVGSSGAATTTSASLVNMLDMLVNITTEGGDLEVLFVGVFSHSVVSTSITVALNLDAGADTSHVLTSAPGAGYAFAIPTLKKFSGVADGNHQILVKWCTGAATASLYSTQRYLLVREVKR